MLENFFQIDSNSKLMIALVGAGGKTTTMLYLADYFKKLDMRVLVTTTTRIFVPDKVCYDSVVMNPKFEFNNENIEKGTVTLAGKGLDEKNKVIGLDKETLDSIYMNSVFDVILIEADGSKRKPIKAPEAHEPVIPIETTHVIGIIGLDALDKRVDTTHVHRLEAFKNITGAQDGDMIDQSMVIDLINHSQGLFKNAPERSKRIVLLNKAVDNELVRRGYEIKESLKTRNIEVFIRGRYND